MIRRAGLSIALVLLALTAIDLGVQHRFPYDRPTSPPDAQFVVRSPTRVRQFPPSAEFTADGVTYRTNALGFRDVDRAPEKPDGVIRVLLLGDSFVEGAGEKREDTIPVQLERRLTASLGRTVEVWNCGVPGASPAVYRWWAPMLAAYSPDAVVIALSDSDLDDDARAVFTREQYQARLWHALPPLLRKSGLVAHATGALASLRAAAVRLRLRKEIPAGNNDDDVSPHGLDQVSDPDRATLDWERSRHFLNQTVEALNEIGIPLLVVHLPSPHTVPAALGDSAEPDAVPDTPAFRHDLYADWLRGWAGVAGTNFADLGPQVTEWYRSARNPPLYQAGQRHFNPAGLDKAAEWIEPELENALIVHTAKKARAVIVP